MSDKRETCRSIQFRNFYLVIFGRRDLASGGVVFIPCLAGHGIEGIVVAFRIVLSEVMARYSVVG